MSTGFSAGVAALLRERAGGRCEVCAVCPDTQSHHRRPRKAGGSRDPATNAVSNGVRVCDRCHRWIEGNRTAAEVSGLLVPAWRMPAECPVWLDTRYGAGAWFLDDLGGYLFSDEYLSRPLCVADTVERARC